MSNKKDNLDLVLSIRGANVVRHVGAVTIADLVQFKDEELLETRCFGETSLREIKEKLAELGLRLGMSPVEVRAHPATRGRIVTESKNANHPGHEPEHDGPCCGHCEAAAKRLRERTLARKVEESEGLTETRRKEIFSALVALQDRGEKSVFASLRQIAQEYRIGIAQVRQIEEEGIDKQWPPFGQAVAVESAGYP
jgi:hypothetical protein